MFLTVFADTQKSLFFKPFLFCMFCLPATPPLTPPNTPEPEQEDVPIAQVANLHGLSNSPESMGPELIQFLQGDNLRLKLIVERLKEHVTQLKNVVNNLHNELVNEREFRDPLRDPRPPGTRRRARSKSLGEKML